MEVKVTSEGAEFKPFSIKIELKVETAQDYASLVEEATLFNTDNEILSDSEGTQYNALIEVSKSLFNTLKQSPNKEGEKQQS